MVAINPTLVGRVPLQQISGLCEATAETRRIPACLARARKSLNYAGPIEFPRHLLWPVLQYAYILYIGMNRYDMYEYMYCCTCKCTYMY